MTLPGSARHHLIFILPSRLTDLPSLGSVFIREDPSREDPSREDQSLFADRSHWLAPSWDEELCVQPTLRGVLSKCKEQDRASPLTVDNN